MRVKDLIEELNLNNIDQLLTAKLKGGCWTTRNQTWMNTWTSTTGWTNDFSG